MNSLADGDGAGDGLVGGGIGAADGDAVGGGVDLAGDGLFGGGVSAGEADGGVAAGGGAHENQQEGCQTFFHHFGLG